MAAWAWSPWATLPSGGVSPEEELRRKKGASSAKGALLCTTLLFELSNHLPASLLSPELYLLYGAFGETLEGGFTLSLAGAF